MDVNDLKGLYAEVNKRMKAALDHLQHEYGGVRTGRKVFGIGRGAFNPVISDGRTIFLTGYSSLYALRPVKK